MAKEDQENDKNKMTVGENEERNGEATVAMKCVKYGVGFVYTVFVICCGTHCLKHGVMAAVNFRICRSGNNSNMYWTFLHLGQIQLQSSPFIKTQKTSRISSFVCILRAFPPP